MPPSSFSGRTYSRKSAIKRKPSPNEQLEEPGIPVLQPRKRPRVSVEIVDSESDDPVTRESSLDIAQRSSPSPVRKSGNVVRTYGTPKRAKKIPSPPDITDSPQKAPQIMRDLSRIFDSVTPASTPSSTPTKLAKRMLTRSKTESSIDSQINATYTDRTASLPNLPSFPSPPKPSASTSYSVLGSEGSSTPRAPVLPLSTTTRTYAGKSRSFLVAIPTSALSGPNGIIPDEEDEYSTRESYTSLRTRWGVDNSEDDPYPPSAVASPSRLSAASTPRGSPRKGKGKALQDQQQAMHIPNGMMNPLKSITELRSKGESRRFLDEVGYLFEGMEAAGGVGLRRASALEIATKLCDAEFARKAKAADFLSRTWEVFIEAGAGRGEDQVLDTLLAFFAALVARDPSDLTDLAQRSSQPPPTATPEKGKQKEDTQKPPSSLVDTLFSLLGASDPLVLVSPLFKDRGLQDAEFKKMGLQKKDRAMFQTIYDTVVSKSSIFPPDTPISTPFLITHTLQSLPPSLIPAYHLQTLLTSIRNILSPFLPPPSSSSSSWPETNHAMHFESVYSHLRMLDTYLLGQWDTVTSISLSRVDESRHNDKEEADNVQQTMEQPEAAMDLARTWLANALVALGTCAEIHGGSSASFITEITFRVLVSLTHGDGEWARSMVECQCANALAWVMRVVAQSAWGTVRRKEEEDMQDTDIKEEVEAEVPPGGKDADDADEEGTQALDRLCLALGLLTNLVQVLEETKDLLREIRLHHSCTLNNRSCIRQCTCASPSSSSFSSHKRKIATVDNSSVGALDVLVQLYVHQLPTSTPTASTPIKEEDEPSPSSHQETLPGRDKERDTADASFLRGHLAVLFGLLMRDNPMNQKYILDLLANVSIGPGERAEDGSKLGLERLIEQAREFAAFYAVLSASASGRHVEGQQETGTDMEVVRESQVARDVVVILENLRAR